MTNTTTTQKPLPLGKRLTQPFGFLIPKFHRKSTEKTTEPKNSALPSIRKPGLFQKHSLEDFLLDTPTPNDGIKVEAKTPNDVLMPSPYDFLQDRPTPVEKPEDIERLQEALLPSPLDFEYQTGRKANKPDEAEIAALCLNFMGAQYIQDPQNKTMIQQMGIRGLANAQRPPTHTNTAVAKGTGKPQYKRKGCSVEGCQNLSRSKGLCKAHGGGRRCSVEGCTRASQSGSLCISHGGGKRCIVEGCTKAAQSKGKCKAHGGGVRCKAEGCNKSSQGDGFCRTHGGGRRCSHPSGCGKWAQRNGMCMVHSEGKYGNSYRGRMQRMKEQDKPETETTAEAETQLV